MLWAMRGEFEGIVTVVEDLRAFQRVSKQLAKSFSPMCSANVFRRLKKIQFGDVHLAMFRLCLLA